MLSLTTTLFISTDLGMWGSEDHEVKKMILWICSVFEVTRECKHSVFLLNWTQPLWIFYLDNDKSQSLQLLN